MAAALLVVGLAQLLTQVGVSAALVQRRELADDDVSAAFAFSVLVALVLAVALAVGAPALGPLVGLPAASGLLRSRPRCCSRASRPVPERLLQRRAAVPTARRRDLSRRARHDRRDVALALAACGRTRWRGRGASPG